MSRRKRRRFRMPDPRVPLRWLVGVVLAWGPVGAVVAWLWWRG